MNGLRDLVLWGATGQAKVLHELIEGTHWRLVALVDNRDVRAPWPGIPVLKGPEGLAEWLKQRPAATTVDGAVAVGGGLGRDRLALTDAMLAMGISIVTFVHRTAFVASDALIGAGSQILAQANVCSGARLGRGVIVNTAASVDHECLLDDGVHVGPGARLAGEVRVGPGVFFGIGSMVLPRISIGADAVIGAGAVVTRDVPSGSVMVGNPARQKGT